MTFISILFLTHEVRLIEIVSKLGHVCTITDSYRRPASFLSDRGHHLHHAKAIRCEKLLKREGKSLPSVCDMKVLPYCCNAIQYSIDDRPIR